MRRCENIRGRFVRVIFTKDYFECAESSLSLKILKRS